MRGISFDELSKVWRNLQVELWGTECSEVGADWVRKPLGGVKSDRRNNDGLRGYV